MPIVAFPICTYFVHSRQPQFLQVGQECLGFHATEREWNKVLSKSRYQASHSVHFRHCEGIHMRTSTDKQ